MTPQEALDANARQIGDRWYFGEPSHDNRGHSHEQALAVASACLLLDVPVTDVVSSRTWLRLIDKVAHLEERLQRLEAQ